MRRISPDAGDFDYADLESPFVECPVCGETYLDEGIDCPYCSKPQEDLPL